MIADILFTLMLFGFVWLWVAIRRNPGRFDRRRFGDDFSSTNASFDASSHHHHGHQHHDPGISHGHHHGGSFGGGHHDGGSFGGGHHDGGSFGGGFDGGGGHHH